MPDEFDVFLSHNSRDKPVVEEIAAYLRDQGLRVWLDEDELRPGFPWQEGLEEGMQASRSVAVFVGINGLGSWQEPEMRAFLARSKREKIPVIPVLLPGCPESPQLPPFFAALTWVNLREGLTDYGLARLVWGITDRKVTREARSRSSKRRVLTPWPSLPSLEVQFADASSLEGHRAFFAAYAGEEPLIPPHPAPSADAESWRVDEAWDASHKVPERGDGKKVNPPTLVAWSPRGDLLVTAADAWGLTTWSVTDRRRVGRDINPTSYGYPLRCFVTQRGSYHYRVLQETSSNLHPYYLIHDGEARRIVSAVNDLHWGFGCTAPGPPASLDGNVGFDPWRPGSEFELAFVENYSTLKIVNVSSLERENALPQGSGSKGWLNALFDLSGPPSSQKSTRSPLHKIAPVSRLDFGSLGGRDSIIFRFLWHPSGEYIAVNTGDWDDRHNRRVHVIHVRTAHIVASIPATATCLKWSPGGRYLLVKKWTQSPASPVGDGRLVPEAGVWDSVPFDARFGELEEILSQSWALHGLHSAPETPDGWGRSRNTALSSDGRRMLNKNGTVITSVKREGCSIHPGEELACISPQAFTHAAWSPTDPYCLATVGGEGSKEHPETYAYWNPGPRHGCLLRIWRGIGATWMLKAR